MNEQLAQPGWDDMKPGKFWFQRLFSHDRRSAERMIRPRLVAYYWDGAAPQAHEIRDISLTGMYLFTPERWRPGTLVTMTLQRTDTSPYARFKRSIAVQAKVIRWGEDGVGFKLFFPEDEDPRKVKSLLDVADRESFGDFIWRFR